MKSVHFRCAWGWYIAFFNEDGTPHSNCFLYRKPMRQTRPKIVNTPIFDPAVEAAANRRARNLFLVLLCILAVTVFIFFRYSGILDPAAPQFVLPDELRP